jgi:hypothetical protein
MITDLSTNNIDKQDISFECQFLLKNEDNIWRKAKEKFNLNVKKIIINYYWNYSNSQWKINTNWNWT